MRDRIQYADDDITPLKRLLRMRIPSLAVGFALGLGLSFITSRFEEVLSQNIQIAFFIPFIVYMASAVGAQTQNIYARDLKSGKASFHKYLVKETALGIILGLVISSIVFVVTFLWLASPKLALAISSAMFGAIALAPIIALLVTELLELEHTDPAVGAGPLVTVVQDTLSILIYGFITSMIIL